ncbi:hypothetical protein CFBP6411_04379 [Pseudomonas syringae group genomosp. 3]|uniref:Uncharacterized protein n=1 Tax=Pseudomonas syringae group genomosp. 3 TaxID=251701 RepID=A0A2K4WIK5_9PSED|nr:hypothetical protein [Pseudomonas syringae group genomosp. 3]SOS35736.1 hypothetical protein CFBP6411_04379 [Pseudomonas syringae group genomosp. 3]
MIELLKWKIRQLQGAELEKFVRRLLPTVSSDYDQLTDTLNHLGRVTQGPADLFAYKQANGRYTAVLCAGQAKGLKAKVLSDIEKLSREDCDIRDEIDQVVICLSATGSTAEAVYRKACARHGWTATVYALDRLADLANKSPELAGTLCAQELYEFGKMQATDVPSVPVVPTVPVKSRFYDCGNRVGIVRASLAMSPSRFIELVDYDSEKRLAYLESKTIDMSESEIANVSEATGVSAEWLMHGKGGMFPIETISTYHWAEMKKLKEANPNSVHMLVNSETQQLALLAHLHANNWKIYSISFDLNFAGWWGDHHQIPEVFDMFKQLEDDYRGRIYGRVIGPKEFADILTGETHPAFFMSATRAAGVHWFEHIFDHGRKGSMAGNYEGWYGEWFISAQDYFNLYSGEIGASPATERI